MSEFVFYLEQGIRHILDIDGMDHMLFACLLCARFKPKEYKQLLIVLTSFTVGHSISLLFTSLGFRILSQDVVELLILVTILLTGLANLLPTLQRKNVLVNYSLAVFFGLIHGMGFSNFFQSMMMGIEPDSLIMNILSFNIGIELGQLIIVAGFMALYFIYGGLFRGDHRYWRLLFSVLGIGFSVWWIAI